MLVFSATSFREVKISKSDFQEKSIENGFILQSKLVAFSKVQSRDKSLMSRT